MFGRLQRLPCGAQTFVWVCVYLSAGNVFAYVRECAHISECDHPQGSRSPLHISHGKPGPNRPYGVISANVRKVYSRLPAV